MLPLFLCRGLTTDTVGAMLTVRAVFSMVSRLLLGHGSGRIGRRELLVVSLALSTAALAVAAHPCRQGSGDGRPRCASRGTRWARWILPSAIRHPAAPGRAAGLTRHTHVTRGTLSGDARRRRPGFPGLPRLGWVESVPCVPSSSVLLQWGRRAAAQ